MWLGGCLFWEKSRKCGLVGCFGEIFSGWWVTFFGGDSRRCGLVSKETTEMLGMTALKRATRAEFHGRELNTILGFVEMRNPCQHGRPLPVGSPLNDTKEGTLKKKHPLSGGTSEQEQSRKYFKTNQEGLVSCVIPYLVQNSREIFWILVNIYFDG